MDQPIRILHIVPNMQAGGLETFIMNIYRNIDRNVVQFDFLVHYSGEFFYDEEIRLLGGKIYNLTVRDDNDFLKYIKDLKKFFNEHKEYRIIHGHMESLGRYYFKQAKNAGVPVRIAHSHNSSTEKTIKGMLKGILLKKYATYATDLFACSKQAGEFMFGKRHFSVINNAIISEKFDYDIITRNKIREELQIQNKIVIGHAGRFCKQKNHRFIIDVFEHISKIEDNAVLVLIGKGETEEEIKRYVCEKALNEKVFFLGVRKDINNLYQAMDCFIFPSLFEGLGIVAIEAQCCGLQVVASEEVPNEAAVTDCFHYCSLKEEPSKWAEMILQHSSLERKSYLMEIKEAEYDVVVVAKKLQKFYLEKTRI